MQHVIRLIRDVCQKCLDQELLASLPVSDDYYISIFAAKNRRRCMEDSHVIINDLQKIFDLKVWFLSYRMRRYSERKLVFRTIRILSHVLQLHRIIF